MAEHAVIERYLRELEREVGWVRNAEEIVEEVADHLLEAVAVHSRRGLDHLAAQRRALSEFGDPQLVGRAFASARSGGIAVPTTFTRRSGVALVASSALWLVALGLFYWSDLADRSRAWEGLPQTLYMFGTLALLAAGIALTLGIVGVNRRHGGALGNTGRLAFVAAVATIITGLAAWAWGGWLTALGLGAVVLATGLYNSDIAPRIAALLIGAGGAVAGAAGWVFEFASDEQLDLGSGSFFATVVVGIAVYSVGLALLGWWLRSETAVEPPVPAVTA